MVPEALLQLGIFTLYYTLAFRYTKLARALLDRRNFVWVVTIVDD
jgi:hypothetical protein